jgi:hypothetical protein
MSALGKLSVTCEEKAAVLSIPAAQRFIVSIKREGRLSEPREVVAPDWFSAWMDAYDAHGMGCKIEVAPA